MEYEYTITAIVEDFYSLITKSWWFLTLNTNMEYHWMNWDELQPKHQALINIYLASKQS